MWVIIEREVWNGLSWGEVGNEDRSAECRMRSTLAKNRLVLVDAKVWRGFVGSRRLR